MGVPPGQGLEILVKKASVDAEFRQLLLADRVAAAKRISLELSPTEAALIAAVPARQLEQIIASTHVPQEHRRAFLGTAAAAMLAVTTGTAALLDGAASTAGGFGGFAAGGYHRETYQLRREFLEMFAEVTGQKPEDVDYQSKLALTAEQAAKLKEAITTKHDLTLTDADLVAAGTVGGLAGYVEKAVDVRKQVHASARTNGKIEGELTRETTLDPATRVRVFRDMKREYRVFLDWDDYRDVPTAGEMVRRVTDDLIRRDRLQTPEQPVKEKPLHGGTFGNRPDPPIQGKPFGAATGIRPE